MSFPQDPRRRRGGAGTGFSSTGGRTAMGYWLPLALTAGVATISIAAWIWSERNDDEDEDDRPHGDGRPYPPPVGPGSDYHPPSYTTGDYARSAGAEALPGDPSYDHSMMARMQGALRRTPSPQQIFDGASKRVVAGVTAAGAFVGGALTSIREDNKGEGDFEDHSRWSEEAQTRAHERSQQSAIAPTMSGGLPSHPANTGSKDKKIVAIVVSSVSSADSDEFPSEHASILSHLPEHVDLETSRIFVLIYAPELKHAIKSPTTPSMASSYSNIGTEEGASVGELASGDLTAVEPRQEDELEGTSRLFKTLYTQAQALVEKDSMIMPFSTPTGYVHLARHLFPELVYVQESLTGDQGEPAVHISNWVRQVIVVVGDEGGRGGLIDSDDESALGEKEEKWWKKEGVTGLGKRIDVVDVVRVGDDWRRRVRGLD
ncbi:unnamed protein product [Penicillium nalgiovense]|uniref:Peroxin-22-like protein Pex22-like-Penicillium chrysogenum n=1 Tax=Penicillium nalgiovense TaxID=60175 RepID=A0A1V6YMM0_PENNA|nr:hypothetical protein PENNAL_c0016G04645 [Penicillium nalgiovense]CAG7936017.1 unnamed protein product [Penicillium nalgiovense]CAG7937791.1 unnamed protein product [Penicillium nalgiovense]CAG7939006.1 unnamed protein product [Penicillium nalgiovense]CAG7939621.1 unnamed protein product [Penicillium nalgiovense]